MPAHAAGPVVLAPGKNAVTISQPYKGLGSRLAMRSKANRWPSHGRPLPRRIVRAGGAMFTGTNHLRHRLCQAAALGRVSDRASPINPLRRHLVLDESQRSAVDLVALLGIRADGVRKLARG